MIFKKILAETHTLNGLPKGRHPHQFTFNNKKEKKKRMRISSAGKTENQNSLPSLYDENFHDGDLRKLLKF